MVKKLVQRIKAWEKAKHKSYERPIETDEDRARAQFFAKWIDHGFLRTRWTNFVQIAPGIYRSNHPHPERVEGFKALGIKTLLNLRGGKLIPTSLLSAEAATKHGITPITVGMSARAAPRAETVLELLDVFEAIEKPFVMHCKSGADRTGLASVIYLYEFEKLPKDVAMKQLSARYWHFKWSKTGVLDLFLETYFKRHEETGISMRDWLLTEYDREATDRAFRKG